MNATTIQPSPMRDTWNISSHEQRGNGYAAGYGRVNDECRGRRNQKSGRCGSNVGCRRVSRIILLLFSIGLIHPPIADAAATEEPESAQRACFRDIGLCQVSRKFSHKKLCKIDKSLCDTAIVHDITGKDEQRNRQRKNFRYRNSSSAW